MDTFETVLPIPRLVNKNTLSYPSTQLAEPTYTYKGTKGEVTVYEDPVTRESQRTEIEVGNNTIMVYRDQTFQEVATGHLVDNRIPVYHLISIVTPKGTEDILLRDSEGKLVSLGSQGNYMAFDSAGKPIGRLSGGRIVKYPFFQEHFLNIFV